MNNMENVAILMKKKTMLLTLTIYTVRVEVDSDPRAYAV